MSAGEDIARLLLAAELKFQRSGEELSRITRESAALRAEADRIRDFQPEPEAQMVLRGAAAGQAAAFEAWRDLRLRELGMRLAEVAAAHDTQRAATRRALGRLEALRRLAGAAHRR